ncbi:hypothetical protein KTH09_11340 [Acinetobacter ursingii]|nr:hypothetical protein [Acinetobacter ursingii]
MQIYKRVHWTSSGDLAQKYDLSVVYIYRILKRMTAIGKAFQISSNNILKIPQLSITSLYTTKIDNSLK